MISPEDSLISGNHHKTSIAQFRLGATDRHVPREDNEFVNRAAGVPDFLGNLDRLKHLMRMIDLDSTDSQASGLTIHRLGDSLVFDKIVESARGEIPLDERTEVELPDPLVLLPSDLLDELYERQNLARAGPPIQVKNTFLHESAVPDIDHALPRYHSAPPGGPLGPPSLNVSPPRALKENFMNGLLRLPPSSPVSNMSPDIVLPFLDNEQISPLSHTNRSVEWNIAGFNVLLGCEIVLMETSTNSLLPIDYSAVRELDHNEFWPNKSDARAAWLESSLLQINKVAWVDSQTKSVELVTSPAELSLEADVGNMLESIGRVLNFLNDECKTQGATYCLVRGSDGYCHLYDVTDVPKDCNVLQVSRELAVPISKVCLSIATSDTQASREDRLRLLAKGWSLVKDDCQGDNELLGLMAIELCGLEASVDARLEYLLHALKLFKDYPSETGQKLLVTTVTLIIQHLAESLELLRISHGLMTVISEERREVECRGLKSRLNALIGRALIVYDESEEHVFTSDSVLIDSFAIPETRLGRLILAVEFLKNSDDIEWQGTALNELGAERLHSDTEGSLENLVEALAKFTDIRSDKQKLLLGAVLMNMSRAFKKLSNMSALDAYSVSNRLRAITLLMLGIKLSRNLSSETAVGNELLSLGAELVTVKSFGAINQHSHRVAEAIQKIRHILGNDQSVLGRAHESLEKRKLGSTSILLGDFEISCDLGHGARTNELARSFLELSLLFCDDSNRAHMRMHVDFHIARLITEMNGDGKEALRHINKVLSSDHAADLFTDALCLKAAIQFKLDDTKGAIQTLVHKLDAGPTIIDCLRNICMHDVKSENPYSKSKALLEAIIRKQDIHFIQSLV